MSHHRRSSTYACSDGSAPGLEVPRVLGRRERRIEPVGVQVVDPDLGAARLERGDRRDRVPPGRTTRRRDGSTRRGAASSPARHRRSASVRSTSAANSARSSKVDVSIAYSPSHVVRVRSPQLTRSALVRIRRPLSFTASTYERGDPYVEMPTIRRTCPRPGFDLAGALVEPETRRRAPSPVRASPS